VKTVKQALVLSAGATPSTDYFVLPHLAKEGYSSTLLDIGKETIQGNDLNEHQVVVISRYLPRNAIGLLRDYRRAGGHIVYFMDDDLFDIRALKGLPKRYQLKIFRNAFLKRSEIEKLCDEFWFATPYLVDKYSSMAPVLLAAAPSTYLLTSNPSVRVCYHGTASHAEEIEWLKEVVAAVQGRSIITFFEVFGGAKVKRLYSDIPRVSVVQPMSWSNYLAWTGCVKRDIALAPLLDTPFNAGRGYIKFFDHVRLRAAGIYSDVPPYRGFVRDGADGILLRNDPNLWSEAILDLARSDEKRERMRKNAEIRAFEHAVESPVEI
jgi:hypothetical protein